MIGGRFNVRNLSLSGLKLFERRPIGDDRGQLERFFCREDFAQAGVSLDIVQINRTVTKAQGTVRGLHFQNPPHSDAKFVSCLRGRVFDVAVDLRRGSPTFLKWHAEELSGDASTSVFIPAGFAHGLQTLTDDCEMLYLHSALHGPVAEGIVSPIDPAVAIAWPRPVTITSDRDRAQPFLSANFSGLAL